MSDGWMEGGADSKIRGRTNDYTLLPSFFCFCFFFSCSAFSLDCSCSCYWEEQHTVTMPFGPVFPPLSTYCVLEVAF